MSCQNPSHAKRYRIALLVCAAALAALFLSAPWIMGQILDIAAAESAPSPQTDRANQLHDKLVTTDTTRTAKSDGIVRTSSEVTINPNGDAIPTRPVEETLFLANEVIEKSTKIVDVVSKSAESVLKVPQNLGPVLKNVSSAPSKGEAGKGLAQSADKSVGAAVANAGNSNTAGVGRVAAGIASHVGKVAGLVK